MQYPTSRGSTQFAAEKNKTTVHPSDSVTRVGLDAIILDAAVAFVTARLQVQVTVSADQFGSNSTSRTRASALFPTGSERIIDSAEGTCEVQLVW